MRPSTVLVFASSFRLGGSERQAIELVRSLDRSRFAPLVACFEAEGPLLEDLPDDIPDPETFPLVRFLHPSTVRQATRFLSLLRRTRVDVVQTFDFYSNVFAVPLARMAGVPAVVGARREGPKQRERRRRRLEHVCLRSAHAIVANASSLERDLVVDGRIPEERVRVIPNGLDISRFSRSANDPVPLEFPAVGDADADALRVGVLGNLRPEKGHRYLFDAVASLPRSAPAFQLYLAGEGPERDDLEDRIAELGLERIVHLLGSVTNAPAFLTSMDIIVLPSVEEGLPNAVIEAMAAGKPVVATRVGGVPELVESEVTGLLVEPARPDELAEALLRLLESDDRRRRMGNAARHRAVDRFDSVRTTRQFEDLYEEILPDSLLDEAARAGTG